MSSDRAILSIQSAVAYGHVGNSAAVFPLQRLGFEVWPVNTVQFSNHTGYGDWRGPVLTVEAVADILTGVEERGVFPRCGAVLSGYMGDASLGHVILDFANRVRTANPRAVYCCDPVMGDTETGFYVRPGIPELMREHAVPAADIVTPNQFELEALTGRDCGTMADALAAAREVRALGPTTVFVTSLQRRDGPEDAIEMIAVDGAGAWRVTVPRLRVYLSGTGDLTAALLLANLLTGRSTAEALAATASSVFAVVEATVADGSGEIRLIEAQDALVAPPRRFEAEAIV
ncbi:MAG: pyridoxal kinase PdxY [Azospirillaceae bacterium]